MSTDTTTTANENAAILGTAKPTAKAVAAKVIARAKAKAPATKPSTKDIDAKIDAALGHKAKGSKPAPAPAPAKAVKAKVAKSRTGIERKFTVKNGVRREVWGRSPEFKARKPFGTYPESFVNEVRAFVKAGHSFMDAKRKYGCSAHWVARQMRSA